MKGSRFSEEQIIGVLREHEAGSKTEEVCRRHGISSATLYKWKSKYGGLEVSEARRLRAVRRAPTCETIPAERAGGYRFLYPKLRGSNLGRNPSCWRWRSRLGKPLSCLRV